MSTLPQHDSSSNSSSRMRQRQRQQQPCTRHPEASGVALLGALLLISASTLLLLLQAWVAAPVAAAVP
jgi:hypothetical protein